MKKIAMFPDEGIPYDGLGPHVYRIVHPDTTGSKNIGMSLCYILPGEEVQYHSHEYEEADFVVQGKGEMLVDGQSVQMKKNLSVYISAGKMHGYKNTGADVMVVLCAMSPPPKNEAPAI